MTVENIIDWFGNYPYIITGYFSVLLILAIVGKLVVNDSNFRSPINYLYGALLYLSIIPGMLSSLLIIYSLFFLQLNLLQLDVFTYYVPVIFMVLIVVLVKKTIALKRVPGFKRLSGLIILITGALIITYILQRMFFGVFFIGQFSYLIGFFGLILLGLKIGWDKLSN